MPRSKVTAEVSRRSRWNADQARAVLARLDSSGLTITEFCESEGLDPQRLHRWLGLLGGARRERTTFVEVVPTAPRAVIEVISPSGHIVRVPEGFSEDALGRVLALLTERTSRC